MECFKNGYVLDTKYEGQKKRFVPPHIFVFSNSLPDISKLSKDRWNIIDINEEFKLNSKCDVKSDFKSDIDETLEEQFAVIDKVELDVSDIRDIKVLSKKLLIELNEEVKQGLVLEHNIKYMDRFKYNAYTNKLWDTELYEWISLA